MYITRSIKLVYSPGQASIHLRELTGNEEMAIRDANTASAIALINSLHSPVKGEFFPAEKMVTADRDHVLASIYCDVFGNKIDGRSTCSECDKPFVVSFQLPDLQQYIQATAEPLPAAEGVYYIGESEFRLPTGEDELAIAHCEAKVAADELLHRCLLKGAAKDREQVEATMARIAPVLQTEIKTECPECGSPQRSGFDIQTYLLAKLKAEQNLLLREIHRIAYTYKWSHREILDLPRRLRKSYSKLIGEDLLQ